MAETDKRLRWRDLFRKDVVAGHVVNAIVGLAVSSALGLAVTIAWLFWAAWRGSFLWTQRLIGASMSFAFFLVVLAVTAIVIRHKLTPARPVAAKGYLDHKSDSDNAQAEMTRLHGKITELTKKETKQVSAHTLRLKKNLALPYQKQLAKKLAESRRLAHLSDKTTKRLGAIVPKLAAAAQTYSNAELAYWTWHTTKSTLSTESALVYVRLMGEQIQALSGLLQSQAVNRSMIESRRGESQVFNEALDRRLEVMIRQSAAVESQIAPLQQVMSLLEPFTRAAPQAPP